MGRLLNGINGPIQGTVGTVVGSSRNGKPYLKAKYKKRKKDVTKTELGNRGKFAKAQAWLKPLLYFVQEGYLKYKKTSGAFVAAKSYLLLNAVEGVQPDIRINPALVKVSVGDLPLSNDMVVAKTADGRLEFTWDTAAVEGSSPYDQVMLLAYDIEKGYADYKTTGQFRSTGSDILEIDTSATGRTYHLYMAFTAADRGRQSDSVYLGTIVN